MSTVKQGEVVAVPNKNKPAFSHAKDQYLAVWVDAYDGALDQCLLFVVSELSDNSRITVKGLDLKVGRLYPIIQGKKAFYLLKVLYDGEEVVFRLADIKIRRAVYRASRNLEDHTKRRFFDELFA